MMYLGIGFLIGLCVFSFVAWFLGFTVKFENTHLEGKDD